MQFEKRSLIYCPSGEKEWMQDSFMTPVPVLIEGKNEEKDKIRLFGGIRDKDGVSRIGFIDVNPENPSEILYVHQEPVLDIGQDGCFDDNGMILGSIIYHDHIWRMYYIGFQHVQKAKFYAFSGVAESNDLINFNRKFQSPVIDRKDWMKFIGAIHTVIKDNNKYKIWYAAGNGWEEIDGKKYPQYSVYYSESRDGFNMNYNINDNIVKASVLEYRIGRPTVFKLKNKYIMFCTSDTVKKEYRVCYFESQDGNNWQRMDEKLKGLERSQGGWDSEMVCYPNLLTYKDKTYCFYNGNGMGKTGVGYAELIGNINDY